MFILNSLRAQKTTIYSAPEVNKFAFNPAYAGMEYSLDIRAWGREQWEGISLGPSTNGIQAHMPVYSLNGAMGLSINQDRVGPFKYFKTELAYDYVQVFESQILSVGAAIGFNQFTFDGGKIRTPDGQYSETVFTHNDPLLENVRIQQWQPYIDLGVYYIAEDWEMGISITDVNFKEIIFETDNSTFDWTLNPSIHVFGSYSYSLDENIDLQPSIYVVSDFENIQSQIKISANYMNTYQIGLGIRGHSKRNLDAIIATIGYKLNANLSMYYTYDVGISNLAQYTNGTHEILFNYNLNKRIGAGTAPRFIENPRLP